MSLILKALKRAQKQSEDAIQQTDAAPRSTPSEKPQKNDEVKAPLKNKSAWSLWYANAILYLVIAFSIAMTLLMTDRISSKVDVTSDQISITRVQLKNFEAQVTAMAAALKQLEATSNSKYQIMKTDSEMTDAEHKRQLDILKQSLSDQKKTTDQISSDYAETQNLIKTYQLENQTLKDEVASLKSQLSSSLKTSTP